LWKPGTWKAAPGARQPTPRAAPHRRPAAGSAGAGAQQSG